MALSVAPFSSVSVFGGIVVDRIATTSRAPTLGASNPGTVRATPGGVGLNLAVTLARLGLTVRLAGVVGDDTDGSMTRAAANRACIDTALTLVDPCQPTATYQAVFDDRGDLVVGVADTTVYEALDPATIAKAANAAHTDGLWAIDANFPTETLAFLISQAEAARRPVVALPISPAKAVRFAAARRRPTLLFANRREAAAMLGLSPDQSRHPVEALATDLGRIGFAHVVVTDSGAPLHVVSGSASRRFIVPEAKPRSVNGAGDALAAGAIYGLSRGEDLFAAVRLGLAAAALTVESEETVRSDLTPALLCERIDEGAVS